MALTFIGPDSFPTYIAEAADVTSGSPLEGANHIGKTVFVTGSQTWYIIDEDLNLQPFSFPETLETAGSGDVQGESILSSSIVTLPSAVVVSGAGTADCNGEYIYDGYIDNKPSYVKGDFKILWRSGDDVFLLMSGQIVCYGSMEDVLSPDLVLEWDVVEGEEPAPTVTALAGMEVVRNVDAGKVLLADGAGGVIWGDVGLPIMM